MTTALQAGGVPLRAWLAYGRSLKRYHRFEVHGFEHLETGRSALLVGYHGTPFAYDQFILSSVIYDRLGYLPHGIFHKVFDQVGPLRWLLQGLGGITRDAEQIRAVVDRGEHIIVLPGGSREAARSVHHRYQVDWGDHLGYLRLAIKYGLPVIPIACHGVDDAYLGLNNGYQLARRLKTPAHLPLWVGFGLGGLWPVAPAFPVKFTQVIGTPLTVTESGNVALDDRKRMGDIHREIQERVQALLLEARRIADRGGEA